MSLAPAPEFREIDANVPEFRSALTMAGIILESIDTSFSVYSRHDHELVIVLAGQVLFEQPITDGQLKLYPLDTAEAMERGKPSCWAFAPGKNGEAEIHVLRYADNALHKRVDVDSAQVPGWVASAFVAEGIHDTLELNIASYLFPSPEGQLTRERTFGGYHLVDRIDTPVEVKEGDWSQAACWSFNGKQPMVTGLCTNGQTTGSHRSR